LKNEIISLLILKIKSFSLKIDSIFTFQSEIPLRKFKEYEKRKKIFDHECIYLLVEYDISDICAKLFVPNPLYRDSTLNEINEDLIEIRNHRYC